MQNPSCSNLQKRKKTSVANYRPVFLTCIICKVLEHIMAWQVIKHMDKHDLLYDLQHDVREKKAKCADSNHPCTCAKYSLGLCSSLIHFAVSNYSVSGIWLTVLGFNDTSTLVSHFVLSPSQRKGEEIKEKVKEMKERDRGERGMKVKKQKKLTPISLPLSAAIIASIVQLLVNLSWTPRWRKIHDTFDSPNHAFS